MWPHDHVIQLPCQLNREAIIWKMELCCIYISLKMPLEVSRVCWTLLYLSKWENILNQCAFPHVHTPCPVLLLWVAYWRVDAKEIRMGTACHAADTMCAAMLQGKKRFRKQDLHFKQPRTPFHSAQLIIFLAPFLKSSNVTEMFPPPSLVQLQTKSCWHFMDSLQCYQRLMVTFPWRVQHLIFPNLKKLGYRHFISKVKFTLGCLFDIEHTPEQILWLTLFLCGGVI